MFQSFDAFFDFLLWLGPFFCGECSAVYGGLQCLPPGACAIYRLGVQSDCLYAEAMPEISGNYDLAFLCMSSGKLQEIAAVPMTREQFEAFDGAAELLVQVEADGYVINEILFRYAHPGIDEKLKSYTDCGGVVTLNLTKDSKPAGHTYVFIERETHQLRLDNAFMSTNYAVYDGFATAKRDVGYDVIKTILK